jgi:hypothetical protein
MDWGHNWWGRSWNVWREGGMVEVAFTEEDGTEVVYEVVGDIPPPEVQEFYRLVDRLMQVSVDEAQVYLDRVRQSMNENVWYIVPLQFVRQPVLANNRLRNVTDQGFSIALNFAAEQLWFEQE